MAEVPNMRILHGQHPRTMQLIADSTGAMIAHRRARRGARRQGRAWRRRGTWRWRRVGVDAFAHLHTTAAALVMQYPFPASLLVWEHAAMVFRLPLHSVVSPPHHVVWPVAGLDGVVEL